MCSSTASGYGDHEEINIEASSQVVSCSRRVIEDRRKPTRGAYFEQASGCIVLSHEPVIASGADWSLKE
jgi:hypothetical protein